jgi:hypothetical protein
MLYLEYRLCVRSARAKLFLTLNGREIMKRSFGTTMLGLTCLVSSACTSGFAPEDDLENEQSVYALDASDAGSAALPDGEPSCGCDTLPELAAVDGSIEFQPDGSAVVRVFLENISNEDFLDYPALRATYWLAHSYQPIKTSPLAQLYGLLAGDRFETMLTIPASDLDPSGHLLVVMVDPSTLAHYDQDPGCVPDGRLELSAEIPAH